MEVMVEGLGENIEEDVLPKDWYQVRCDKAFVAKTRDGDDMLKVELTITDGPTLDSGGSPIGRKLFAQLIHPRRDMKDGGVFANRKLTKAIEAFGGSINPGHGYDPEELVGQTAMAFVDQRTYDDELSYEVKKFRAT